MRILYFVPIFCIIFKTLPISAEHERIYGGYPINITDAPYMVHITLFSEVFANGSAIGNSCGGTILRKNLILTAGHCVQRTDDSAETYGPERFWVEVGSTLKHGGKRYYVSRVFPHPKFQGGANNKHHDIGLLELTTDIPIGPTSQYTKLVHKNDQIKAGNDGIVNGWGTNPDNPHDDRLYQVHLSVLSSQECARLDPGDTAEGYEKHEICVYSPGKNFCPGDSGGPYIDTETGRQIGVISFISDKDCTRELPSVACRIQDNLDFINDVIKKTRRNNSGRK